MHSLPKILTISAVTLCLVGCKAKSYDGVYDIRGAVVTIDSAKMTVELDHEKIGDFMDAMNMAYPVADAALLRGLKPGDSVQGKLKVASENYTITSLSKR